MALKKKIIAGAATATILLTGTIPYNVFAEQPTLSQLTGGNAVTVEEFEIIEKNEPAAVERIKGYSRYDTAIEISQKGWEGGSVDKVIIASGKDFADALAGVPLAHAWDTPILLTPDNRMLDETLAEIERLGAKEVYILGGEVAVNKDAEETLENAGLTVNRISGHSRYDTAVEIANELTGGQAEKVIVSNGKDFADSLSVASLAAQKGIPVLLTLTDALPQGTEEAIENLGVKETLILGGELAVSEEVKAELPGNKRISGQNRYATNIAILEEFGVDSSSLYVASGKDYADALTGAVLAAKEETGVVLVRDIVPTEIAEYLKEEAPEELAIFGGELAVSDAVKKALQEFVVAPVKPEEPKESFDLSIMHTNDTHANLDNMPKTVTAIKDVREEKPNSLLLNAGDVFSGTLYFNEFEGKADLDLMNLMGYDAMTFGNHEFDLGSSEAGHQALADFVQGAKFPFVSANVDFSKDDKFTGLFSDLITSEPEEGKIYNGIVKEVDGEKVGIFGLTTAETAAISSPGAIEFEDYIEEAEKAVTAFEGQGVDKIIALTHIGFDDNAEMDNDQVLAATVEGIDVVVGGHSHTQLDEPVVVTEDETGEEKDPTVIVQAYQYNDFLGKLDVEFDADGVVVGHAGELIEIGEQEADAEAAQILAPYQEKVDKVSETEIGVSTEFELENPRTSGDDTLSSVRKNETILGNIITDGMLTKAKEYNENVVMAFQNGGGIRAEINAGPITVGEVITVLPFGNTLATMDLTGAELKEAFEISFGQYPAENGGFLHVAGAKVEFDSTKPAGERVVSVFYESENGSLTEVKDGETYTIATNAFTAKGGDGYDVFANAYADNRVTDLGLSDWENLQEQLVKIGSDGVPTDTEGRIVDVSAQDTVVEVASGEFSGTTENPKVYESSVMVDATDVSTFENATVKGDLILTGKLEEEATFKNINVEGNLDISSLETDRFQFEGVGVTGETIL